jgi:hypothetical protein
LIESARDFAVALVIVELSLLHKNVKNKDLIKNMTT